MGRVRSSSAGLKTSDIYKLSARNAKGVGLPSPRNPAEEFNRKQGERSLCYGRSREPIMSGVPRGLWTHQKVFGRNPDQRERKIAANR